MYFVHVDRHGNTKGTFSAIWLGEYLYHHADLDTYIRLQADNIQLVAGGVQGAQIDTAGLLASYGFRLGRSTVTIAAGEITATRAFHLVETQAAAATDDLDTINGWVDGDVLVLTPYDNGHTVVVKDNTGNIQCAGDFSMDSFHDTMTLVFNTTRGKWHELSRSNNA